MKLFSFLVSALVASSALAAPLKTKIEHGIKGQVKLLIDMDQMSDPVDVLFVIDDSGSMSSYQAAVVANADAFMDKLAAGGTSWRLGLISTSLEENPAIGLAAGTELDPSTPDVVQKFKNAVLTLGVNGNNIEQPFDSINKALTAYPNFLRPDARLVIIVISDAPEQSTVSPGDLVKALTAWKGGDASKISFYGFLGPQDWCAPTDDPFVWAGSTYQQFTDAIKGDATPICTADFGTKLIKVGDTLNRMSRAGQPSISEIPLPSMPDSATITVNFGTQIIEKGVIQTGWIYDSTKNEVLLGNQIPWSVQPAKTPLEVTYTPKDWE